MAVFQIRFPDGSMASGSVPPRKTSHGKVWSTISHLRAHLTMVTKWWLQTKHELHPYEGAELVTLGEIGSCPLEGGELQMAMDKLEDKNHRLRYHHGSDHYRVQLEKLAEYKACTGGG